MKKFFNLLIIIFLLTGLYKIFIGPNTDVRDAVLAPPSKVEIKTFSSNKAVPEKVFKESPKETTKVSSEKKITPVEPEPVPVYNDERPKDDMIQGRVVLGGDFMPVKQIPAQYTFENDINPNWKTLAMKEFVDEEEDMSRVEIDHLESQVFLREGVALYIEKVKIRVSEMDGLGGEFMAYVDSSSGEVLHAWDPGSKPFDDPAVAEPVLEDFEDYNSVPYEEDISTNSLED